MGEIEETDRIEADLLVTGGLVLTMDTESTLFADGAVAVAGDRILAVGEAADLEKRVVASQRLDAGECLIMPGLINLHTHAAMVCFRGLADDLPLETWLHQHIFPAESRHVNEERVYWGTLLAMLEMIRGGTTTFCDGYFCEDGAARAVTAGGLRAVLAQGVVDFPAPGVPDPRENLRVAEGFVRRWQGACQRLRPGIFCHSAYTCSPETLTAAKEVCAGSGALFQIHLAETRAEVEEIFRLHGRRPVVFLQELGLLDDATLCHHAVWIDREEIELLARAGVGVSHNPESNMKLAAGVAPLPEMLAAGLKVGLGTDGCASNNNLDLLQEMDTAAKLHKCHRRDPAVCSAREITAVVTNGAAAALGMAEEIGSLEPGKKADIITVDLRQPHLTPFYEPCSHLVYTARGADVRDVIVDGQMLMHRRQVLVVDEEEVLARMREIAAKISSV